MRVNVFEKEAILEKIRNGIYSFEMTNGKSPRYIVMSHDTRNVIISHDVVFYSNGNMMPSDAIFGIPISFYEGLSYGVVDIV